MVRKIFFYKDYFLKFYRNQEPKVQQKIEYVLDLIRFEQQVPVKFFKKLQNTDDIYEVRVITFRKSIRILCFIHDGDVIILMNTFEKKSQKTPQKEIQLAERLKKEYLDNKGK